MSGLGNRLKHTGLGVLSTFAIITASLAIPVPGLEEVYAQSTYTPLAASTGQLTSALGALNAAHANSEAFANAAPQSEVSKIAAYDKAMLVALALPTATSPEVAYRDQQIAEARATYLAAAANKPLNPSVVTKVDSVLGLPASDPALGVVDTAASLHGIGQTVGHDENVVHAHVDQPSIDRPDIQHPNIQRPQIQRPNIERPNIPH